MSSAVQSEGVPVTEVDLRHQSISYMEANSRAMNSHEVAARTSDPEREVRVVDVVLSDMSEPWAQVQSWKRSLSDPYYRMMNTSGINFRDHSGSMVSTLDAQAKRILTETSRICVMRLFVLHSMFSKSVDILFANFTKVLRTNTWRLDLSCCSPRYIGRSLIHHEV